jgi:FAD/FMN-containing dehydrogenase
LLFYQCTEENTLNTNTQVNQEMLAALITVLGKDNVLFDDYSTSLYAQDIFTKDIPAEVVVSPSNKHELGEILKITEKFEMIVVPRGGGMSYTKGYVPAKAHSVLVDMSGMDKVIEINTQDMFVTVECGCTWQKLHQALKNKGVRTPYWGTLSGSKATIGGGLSQNAIFWGSGQFGTAADSVIGLEVVLADGTLVTTGSGAQVNSTPFFRHYGPDLTGIFTCDNGALGFKATATFRLIPELPAKGFLAFDFKQGQDCLAAMSEISRQGLAMECFGFDPFLQSQRLKRESLSKDVKALAGVMKSSDSLFAALKDGAKLAMAGRSYMKDVAYSVQVIVEDRIDAGVNARMQDIRAIAKQYNGSEIENSIPKITRSNPFGPVNTILGPQGERWVPVHGLFPHSKIQQAFDGVEAIFAKHVADMEKFEIGVGYLFAVVATHCFVIEPVFFWPDAYTEIHEKSIETNHFAKLIKHQENLAARAQVTQIRNELSVFFNDLGGVHLQVGKTYQFKQGLHPDTYKIIKGIKDLLDPQGRVNPQTLGLE